MDASVSAVPSSERSAMRFVGQAIAVVLIGTLAYQALHFWARDR